MSFLDENGLAYFYDKINDKYIQTVTAGEDVLAPDDNGNVTITHVATADNLLSPNARGDYDAFIFRTSGGAVNINSGDAELVYIDGNSIITERIEESLVISATTLNLNVDVNLEVWKNTLDNPESGTYIFNYTCPALSTEATTSWNTSGIWAFGGSSPVYLTDYGLDIKNMVDPDLELTVAAGETIDETTIIPKTWFTTIGINDGKYTFVYSPDEENGWVLNSDTSNIISSEDLAETYGIQLSPGTPVSGDTIVVDSVRGTPSGTLQAIYTKLDPGHIINAFPSVFRATGFNAFDASSEDMVIANASILTNPETGKLEIRSSDNTYVAWCKAVGGLSAGYVAYSNTNYTDATLEPSGHILNLGYCATKPSFNVEVTTIETPDPVFSTINFEDDGYIVAAVDNINYLAMHPRWSDSTKDFHYEDYTVSTIALPSQGKYNNEFVDLPLTQWGMPAVGNISDRLNLEAKTYIQKIGRVANTSINMQDIIALNTPYIYDENYIYYVLLQFKEYTELAVTSTYQVNDYGTEEFTNTIVPVYAQTLYGENLSDKLRNDVITISKMEPSLTNDQQKTVCNNIGALRTVGGSTTGSIKIVSSNVYGGSTSSESWYGIYGNSELALWGQPDINDSSPNPPLTRFGYFIPQIENGKQGIQFSATRKILDNGVFKDVYHGLTLGIDDKGNYSVYFSKPEAWLDALGLTPSTITNIRTITNANSSNETTNAKITEIYFRQNANMAQLFMTWQNKSAISVKASGDITNIQVCQLKSGYRPAVNAFGASRGDGAGAAWYAVDANGIITLCACEGTGSSRTIAAKSTFYLYATFMK